jgi:hypothetical protein
MTRRRALVTLSLALLVAAGLVGLGRATAPDPAASSRGYRDGFETAPLPTAARAAARAAFAHHLRHRLAGPSATTVTSSGPPRATRPRRLAA